MQSLGNFAGCAKPRSPLGTTHRRSARVHDPGYADEADERAREVGAVGMEAVERDTPEQRTDDEHAAVGREHSPELVAGLERRDHAMSGQRIAPDATKIAPLWSLMPTHTRYAPPVSATAAATNSAIERAVTPAWCQPVRLAPGSDPRVAIRVASAAAARWSAAIAPASTAKAFSSMSLW